MSAILEVYEKEATTADKRASRGRRSTNRKVWFHSFNER